MGRKRIDQKYEKLVLMRCKEPGLWFGVGNQCSVTAGRSFSEHLITTGFVFRLPDSSPETWVDLQIPRLLANSPYSR